MTTLCAIDPGTSGGISWKWPSCKAIAMKMPATDGDIITLLRHIITGQEPNVGAKTIFYLEDLVKFANKQCSQSNIATYAAGWGTLKGCIQYSGSVLHLVRPQAWTKSLSLGTKGDRTPTQWKNHLKAHAQRIFPHLAVTLATADALCILHYAQIQNREFTGL